MSLQSQIIRQRDFSAGEIDPDSIRRDDTDILKSGVRYARNLVSTHTGALTRRPGRRLLFEDVGIVMDFKPFDDIVYRVVFTDGGVKVRRKDGELVATLSAAWTSDDLDSLVFVSFDNEIFVAWSERIRVVKVSKGTLEWSISDYSFGLGLNDAQQMPFYRFPDTQDITMKVSSTTGSGITVQFSESVLNSGHAGVVFRYAGRQLRIVAVSSPTIASANVIEELPPTKNITVSNSSGFSVGQTVETDVTNAKGEIAAIAGNVITVVLLDNLTVPDTSDKLVGPTANSQITQVSSTTPAAILQWDEQFVSDYRGWPRSIAKDRERLIMSNFPQKKNAILWTATGDTRNALIGSDADDAMLEFISADCQVYHVVGGYDEFAVTDRGVFFIPISVGEPLKPGSVEFRPVFSSQIANIRPVEVTEGLIFVDKSMTGIYAVSATGQTARPYLANEINRFHRHLFNDVKSIAATPATTEFPSRQIFVVNGDGTVVAGQFNPDTNYVGWLKWDGAGTVRSVSGDYGSVVFMTTYLLGGVSIGVAEELDYSLLCDCAKIVDTTNASGVLELSGGGSLTLSTNAPLSLSYLAVGFFAGETVSVHADGFYFGEISVSAEGVISGFSGYDTITIGIGYAWSFRPLFTRFDDGSPVGQGEKRRKIENMMLTVRETQEFQVGNRVFGSYRGGDDMSDPVPQRDETYRYREVGRSHDPDVEIRQTFPGTFKIIELATRITV